MEKQRLYFWAVIPDLNSLAIFQKLKMEWAERYQSFRSLNSPPHITILPPRHYTYDQIQYLKSSISLQVDQLKEFDLLFKSFGRFQKRVIYLKPAPNAKLLELYEASKKPFEVLFGSVKHPLFSPHLTLVFKDLSEEQFNRAWARWSETSVDYGCKVDGVYLLEYFKGSWREVEKNTFSGP